jgi:hypothetical protein
MAGHQSRLRVIVFRVGVQPNGEEITMSAFERFLAIADEETLDLARAMIGKPELALLLAKEALKNTTEVLSPITVAEVLGISKNGATNKIDNCTISERPAWDDWTSWDLHARLLSAWQLGQKKGAPKSSVSGSWKPKCWQAPKALIGWRQLRSEAGRCTGLVSHEQWSTTTNMNREEFANLILQLEDYRIAHQHTYSELADLLGVPRVTLRKWIDTDHVARPQTVQRIKEFLRLRALWEHRWTPTRGTFSGAWKVIDTQIWFMALVNPQLQKQIEELFPLVVAWVE